MQHGIDLYQKVGYAYFSGAPYPNVRRVAAPLFDEEMKLVGCLAIGGSLLNISVRQVREYGDILKAAAKGLSGMGAEGVGPE